MLTRLVAPPASNGAGPQRNAAYPIGAVHHAHAIVLLRWVLIVATSYLVLFSRPLAQITPMMALFVAAYLGSNVVLTELLPRLHASTRLEWVLVIIDVVALTTAIVLTDSPSHDLFVLYFAVLFLSALSERVGLVVGAAVLTTVAHLYTVSRFVDFGALVQQGYMLRIPFLFVVALFFGQLVQHARARERQAEEARARELRLDALSALGHDLKNPLGVIDSLADLLLDGSAGALSREQADLVGRIRASARQAIGLSQNLIEAERVDAGRLTLNRCRASIGNVVERALAVATSASALKGIALHATIEPGLPPIDVDPVQIERVLANLLGNAIKFTPAGGRVALDARRLADAIRLTVTDDGPGIAADELPRLAERHFRGARARGVDGSGLGLFIVRAVVDAHGGQLHVRSAIGRGTAVTVILPLAPIGASLDGANTADLATAPAVAVAI
jgi:signal transduction histidine kinase